MDHPLDNINKNLYICRKDKDMAKRKTITNWGGYPAVNSEVWENEFLGDIMDTVKKEEGLIARGNGRCYGDAALSERIISTLKYNKFIRFEPENRLFECQSGALFSDILEFLIPRGFFLPVTPGTKFITVGGAIAADVHGKNHHKEGSFSNHLLSFELLDGEGRLRVCSRESNAELFWETVGGMGLTGIILSARFYIKPIESAYIVEEKIKARNLDEVVELFDQSQSWTYTVAWIDCLQRGSSIGRSILMRGEHAKRTDLPASLEEHSLKIKKKLQVNIPFNFPSFALNSLSIRAFNFLYYHKQFKKKVCGITDYETFFYPLDSVLNWNRMYGKTGLTQYQFVLPMETYRYGLPEILKKIGEHRLGSFLAVLKYFGKPDPLAKNSFPMEGYTLALDFKIQPGLKRLFEQLDHMVAEYQGKIYLAKDAFSRGNLFPEIQRDKKFISYQYKRINTI